MSSDASRGGFCRQGNANPQSLAQVHDRKRKLVGTLAGGSNVDHEVGLALFQFHERRLELLVGSENFPVQGVAATCIHLRGRQIVSLDLAINRPALRQGERKSLLKNGCCDDKDDQEDEGQVEQRRDVDVIQRHQ